MFNSDNYFHLSPVFLTDFGLSFFFQWAWLKPVTVTLKATNLHPCCSEVTLQSLPSLQPAVLKHGFIVLLTLWRKKDKEKSPLHPGGLAESGIDLSAENPWIVFSLITLHQIDSEGINHHERHGCSWGERLLNFAQKQLHLRGALL